MNRLFIIFIIYFSFISLSGKVLIEYQSLPYVLRISPESVSMYACTNDDLLDGFGNHSEPPGQSDGLANEEDDCNCTYGPTSNKGCPLPDADPSGSITSTPTSQPTFTPIPTPFVLDANSPICQTTPRGTRRINIRNESNQDGQRVGVFDYTEFAEILAVEGNWIKIRVEQLDGEKIGWSLASELQTPTGKGCNICKKLQEYSYPSSITSQLCNNNSSTASLAFILFNELDNTRDVFFIAGDYVRSLSKIGSNYRTKLESYPSISPSGKLISYLAQSSEQKTLEVVDIASEPYRFFSPLEIPDLKLGKIVWTTDSTILITRENGNVYEVKVNDNIASLELSLEPLTSLGISDLDASRIINPLATDRYLVGVHSTEIVWGENTPTNLVAIPNEYQCSTISQTVFGAELLTDIRIFFVCQLDDSYQLMLYSVAHQNLEMQPIHGNIQHLRSWSTGFLSYIDGHDLFLAEIDGSSVTPPFKFDLQLGRIINEVSPIQP